MSTHLDTIGPSENRVWKADPLLEDREILEPYGRAAALPRGRYLNSRRRASTLQGHR
jgi:hypothetical protein